LYSDRTLINRRDITHDPHSNYCADRDFFLLILQSRVIVAAMNALGLEHKTSEPDSNLFFHPQRHLFIVQAKKKLELLHEAAGIVVDKFVFRGDGLSGMINNVLTTQEREEIINSQELTDDGRFPCRFQGCRFSFNFDGKSRRKHELTHNPPPVIQECTNLPITSEKSNM